MGAQLKQLERFCYSKWCVFPFCKAYSSVLEACFQLAFQCHTFDQVLSEIICNEVPDLHLLNSVVGVCIPIYVLCMYHCKD